MAVLARVGQMTVGENTTGASKATSVLLCTLARRVRVSTDLATDLMNWPLGALRR